MTVMRETALATVEERQELIASLPTRLNDVLHRRVRETPDLPVIYAGPDIYSYADLGRGVEAATAILRDAGLRAGDRALLIMENSFAGVCCLYAIMALDAWAVLANSRLTVRERDVMIDKAQPRLIVCVIGDKPETHDLAPVGSSGYRGTACGTFAVSTADPSVIPEPVPDRTDEQVAVMLFTSGTTGVPKAAMLGHKSLMYQSSILSERRGFGPGDCPYLVAPIVHVLGLAGIFLPAVYSGSAVELATRFDADFVMEGLRQNKLTHLYGAPPMISMLVDRARQEGAALDVGKLRELFSGGALVDRGLCDRVEQTFGMKLSIGYAATECTPIAASSPALPANPGAVGLPFPGIDVRVVGLDGTPLPTGETGEIQCNGPNIMLGYYRDPEATALAIDDAGWLSMGDLGFFDDDGQVHLVGRLKDLITRSGFNVYPAEIEGVLNIYPDVLQSAVVGRVVPGNEEVIAFVEAISGAEINVAELAAYAAERLAPYKKPAHIEVLSKLPVGATGKLLKTELREIADRLDQA
jgi:long-chain acyl-CoA synthetase